jgi:glycosyltransferase involved in cell wall biosynthesis
MKVVIPMGILHLGGGCRVLVEIANALVKRGHDVEIPLLDVSTNIYEVKCKLTKIPSLSPQYIPYGDILLPNFYTTFPPAFRAWPKQTVRLSLGFEPYWVSDKAGALWTYQQGVPIISISRWLDDQIFRHVGQRSTVINPGIDPSIFKPSPYLNQFRGKLTKTILYIARDPGAGYALKGFYDFMLAMQIVRSRYEGNLIVHMICPEKELKLPGIACRTFRPNNDLEMAELYRSADLFVSSSWFEGYALPPLEAMACGTPVVTTNSGGIADFCTHMESAYITPPRNPHALAEGILTILNDEALYHRLLAGGLRTARMFTKDRFEQQIVNTLEQIYQQRKR